jgi:murein DD-endopeptidase MepM/ murein hydrolase activator NlpD
MNGRRSTGHVDHAHGHPQGRSTRFIVEHIEYAPAELLLRLSLRVSVEPRANPAPELLIEHGGEVELCYSPMLGCASRLPGSGAARFNDDGDWRWRGAFAVPPDVVADPFARFALRLRTDIVLPLPAPGVGSLASTAGSRTGARARSGPQLLWRGGLALVIAAQLMLAPGVGSVRALAAASSGTAEGAGEPAPPALAGEAPTETTPTPAPEGEGTTQTTPAPETPVPPIPVPPTPGVGEPGSELTEGIAQGEPPALPTGDPRPPRADAPPAIASASGSATPSQSASTGASSEAGSAPLAAAVPSGRVRHPGSHVTRTQHAAARAHARSAAPAARAVTEDEPLRTGAFALEAGAISPMLAQLTGLLGGVEEGPPAYLVPIYKAAAHRYHVPWRVLAAINAIETDYGRNLSVSSAGAEGWMQFMPATWSEWAVDADRDGRKNPYSPQDAIFSAARYLAASGAQTDLPRAIFAYNHADWYVTEVLLRARLLASAASFAHIENGYSLPLDARYLRELGRTDDGVDIETAPDGALVYSMTPGVVTAVASNPGGFGPNYPVVQVTGGSLKGENIYYGHVAASLVRAGESVVAGQPLAIMGHTGDAASLDHGHIEIGFSDAAGNPLNHHGAAAWTPSGDIMRSFLVALSGAFGVQNE